MSTLTHIGSNVLLLMVSGAAVEPYTNRRKIVYIVFGLGYVSIYLANVTVIVHKFWTFAGASGGVLALLGYSGLKLHNIAFEYSGIELSRDGIEQFTAFFLILTIPVIILYEGGLSGRFHSAHILGIVSGILFYSFEYYYE